MIQIKMLLEEMKGSGGVLSFGVHEGIEFLGLERDFTGEFADLKFGNMEGTIHKRLFKPSGKFLREGETVDSAVKREERENLNHVARMLQICLGDKADEVQAETYDACIETASLLLSPFKGTKVNLRVSPKPGKTAGVLYADLGNYPMSYVEIHTPGKPSTLKLSKAHQELLVEKKEDGADLGDLV